MTDPSRPIENVSDTARWVAFYRALESERRDAHFHDPFARRLAGERGEAIMRSLPQGKSMAWAITVRTCLFDEMITRLIERNGVDAVLDLASGLDARPWRMRLPATLGWYDVDLPGILAHKHGLLAGDRPACRLEPRAVDLTDPAARRELFAEVGSVARNVAILTEGLLIYLTAEQVAALGRDLHAQASFRWWIADLVSPALLRTLEGSWAPRLRAANAPLQFGPAEGARFFEPLGWKEVECRSIWDESQRLGRGMTSTWLWRLIDRLTPRARRQEWRNFSSVVLLERIDS